MVDSEQARYAFKIGTFDCTVLLDESGTDAIHRLLSEVPEDERNRVLAARGLQMDDLYMTFNPLLIEADGQRILIDTGNGVETGGNGQLLPRLVEAGFPLESVNVVVLSHAHADHYAAMLTAEGGKTFPNARYVMWADEWDYYSSPERMKIEKERGEERHAFISKWFLPLKPYLTLIDADHPEIVPGIRAVYAPGHTRHHIAIEIESENEVLLYVADAGVHPLFVENPHWGFAVDYDQEQAKATRRALNDRAIAKDALVLGYHFPFPGLGTVLQENGDYLWQSVAE